jgi:uncharacterized RDD family membrane protein YckC
VASVVGAEIATRSSRLPPRLVAFDPRKQGWHDKVAGTVVVRPLRGSGPLATFDH